MEWEKTDPPDEAVTLIHEITDDGNVEPPSLAEQLRARRAEIAESQDVMLPLTGYEEHGVLVKHRLMDRHEVEGIGRKVLSETRDRAERNMRILLDIIIGSTSAFMIKLEENEGPTPILDDRNGNQPIFEWYNFALYLGWQPEGQSNSRTALYYVFSHNEFAIGQYGIMLNRWMGNTGIKVDEEFLGEML